MRREVQRLRMQLQTAGFIIGVAVIASVVATGDDWPVFRGNAESNGVASSELPEELEILWKFTVPNSAFESTAAIVDGIVYITDYDGTLFALDLETGEKKWEAETEIGFSASPSVRDGLIFIGDLAGEFYCFDTQGEKKWQFTAYAEINSSANFYKDNVIFGSQDATLYCLNAKSGAEVWRFQIDDQIRCTPTVVDNRAFVAGCDGRLHVIDLDNGSNAGSVEMAPTMVTPAVSGDQVFCGTEQSGFYAIDWRQLKSIWHQDTQAPIRSSPAVVQRDGKSTVVFGAQNRQVYALDASNGDPVWSFTAHNNVDASPVIVGDRVIVAGGDGRLYLLDIADGRVRFELELGGGFSSSPAVADSRLVIATRRGVVYCLGSK